MYASDTFKNVALACVHQGVYKHMAQVGRHSNHQILLQILTVYMRFLQTLLYYHSRCPYPKSKPSVIRTHCNARTSQYYSLKGNSFLLGWSCVKFFILSINADVMSAIFIK
jgi:hypothetical protein